MTPEELRKLIGQEESLKLEFKKEYKFLMQRPEGINPQIWNQYVDGQWDEFIKDVLALTNGNVTVADQTSYLIVGVSDQIASDGNRELFDTRDANFNQQQIVAKVNSACKPPIPNILVDQIELDGKFITVIEIPASPYIHETSRKLKIPKSHFDDETGNLSKVDLKNTTDFNKNTVFIRHNDSIEPAGQDEILALKNEKWKLYGVSESEPEPKGLIPKFTKKLKENLIWTALVFIIFTLIPTLFVYRDEFAPWFEDKVMQGEFNIAVAEFSVIDPTGDTVRSEDGNQMAQFLYERMENAFTDLELKNINYEIWGPDQTGKIEGANLEDRNQAAEDLVQKIGAHVLIYGTIVTGDNPSLIPEFYVNFQGFDQAAEITGQHQLGKPFRVVLPFDAQKIQEVENPALSARVNALSLLTIGLAYYSIDDLDQALTYYQIAEEVEGWLQNAGKEVLFLLIGDANMRLSSIHKSDEFFEPAMSAFNKALEINPEYARAKIGQAGVLYLIALGDPANPSFETVDLDKLAEAETAYREALTFSNSPTSANIPIKVDFGLGQIYLVRNQVSGSDNYQASVDAFKKVIQAYEEGNNQLKDYASHAYARLGLIYYLQERYSLAIDHFKKAIRDASPAFEAAHWATVGEIYLVDGQKELAVEAYNEAINIAEFYADEESVTKYSERLLEIK